MLSSGLRTRATLSERAQLREHDDALWAHEYSYRELLLSLQM